MQIVPIKELHYALILNIILELPTLAPQPDTVKDIVYKNPQSLSCIDPGLRRFIEAERAI